MKFKVGDQVTSPCFISGELGTITEVLYDDIIHENFYRVETEECYWLGLYEEDLELVEAPAQAYLDLFI